MAQKKDEIDWGWNGVRGSAAVHAEMVRNTKLRTLADMSEREIKALERLYGCPIVRPIRSKRGGGARATPSS